MNNSINARLYRATISGFSGLEYQLQHQGGERTNYWLETMRQGEIVVFINAKDISEANQKAREVIENDFKDTANPEFTPILRVECVERDTQDIITRVDMLMAEQRGMLNGEDGSADALRYVQEFTEDGKLQEGETVASFIENLDIDSVEFNAGFEQGYHHALECILRELRK